MGSTWAVLEDAEKPVDPRKKNGYKVMMEERLDEMELVSCVKRLDQPELLI